MPEHAVIFPILPISGGVSATDVACLPGLLFS
ncbi:hypothetical protein PAN31108_01484 [Pandoraea anhela]|uniref:Uncharacterized protein n=1 Tax=Pandoraea anhela TaxID=2508295 RepID=A0A5E4TP19_9BURK|nr:hypothetical protein PAN31108_01484 [Pandoraea anhela]